MFKKTLLMAIAFISMMVFASTASAQTTIYGCLDKVYINKDKNPVHQNDVSPALNTTLTPNGDGSYKLELSEFKVGKMPAKLKVVANKVVLDGSTVNECDNAIILSFGAGLKFDATIEGSYDASTGKLEYTVKSVDASFLGVDFDTEVHFTTECTIK
ncbi:MULTISPECIES: hypothetical protein [Bacteroidales]|jgi:hypothetical protein|nr:MULTISPECIES: hypothetical protein [Bacteroidales]MBM0143636.1 hypothetical protein [Segatella copri]MCW4072949.1 hypothetical protein [Segatella copri]MCW4082848.1 hypothetical protein [Segatella copri]MCW4086480.1 hypothetical protein [Segatella copri]MCW4117533.1 hypothetical protein [Segatella copri]